MSNNLNNRKNFQMNLCNIEKPFAALFYHQSRNEHTVNYGMFYVNMCPVREWIQVTKLSDRLTRYKFAYEAWHVYDSTFCVKIYENKLKIHDWHWSVWRTTLAVNWLILSEIHCRSVLFNRTFRRDRYFYLWSILLSGNFSNYCILDSWHGNFKGI